MHILVYRLVLLPMRHPPTLYFGFNFMNLTQQARMLPSIDFNIVAAKLLCAAIAGLLLPTALPSVSKLKLRPLVQLFDRG